MYLSMLSEKRKNDFLELAYHMALINNDFSEKERIMIENYCNEMQIAIPEVIHTKPIDEIIESMRSECTMAEKKIMIFEILGLALVDGNYDKSEERIVEEIAKALEIGESFLQESKKVLQEYIEIQGKINTLVLV